jgi:hypothetical protein
MRTTADHRGMVEWSLGKEGAGHPAPEAGCRRARDDHDRRSGGHGR